MKQIHRRAHQYAVAHGRNGDGVGLMRAYTVGALEERKRMRVFVSGKVSGEEYYVAYGKFANAERALQQMGYATVNPMKICKRDWCWLRCMAKCLWALMFCDKVYQLPDWRESRGASEIAPGEHLPQYTQSVEELADVVISALTELYARVDDVEEVIVAKINYNKTRV